MLTDLFILLEPGLFFPSQAFYRHIFFYHLFPSVSFFELSITKCLAFTAAFLLSILFTCQTIAIFALSRTSLCSPRRHIPNCLLLMPSFSVFPQINRNFHFLPLRSSTHHHSTRHFPHNFRISFLAASSTQLFYTIHLLYP